MSGLGIAHLSALALAPAELVRQAGRAGFSHVGLRLHPASAGGIAYPLRPGSPELLALQQALVEYPVAVNDIEFIELTPQVNVAAFDAMLETGAQLGAASLTVSGDDPEAQRLAANFAALCERAEGYGIRVNLEFMRWRVVGNLQQAVAVLEAAGHGNGGLLVDALHLFRAGNTPAQLAALNPAWLKDVQLCDAPLQAPPEALIIQEARQGRLPPGEGELPLAALMAALPREVRVSVEVPMPGVAVEVLFKRLMVPRPA
ncbi:TIM barrel protein [Pseudomonas sp. NPDC007930]|uniref:sugar phosphate isomerase/epimerase family protein n=1 Tax=Pseudomonas sp. NPDC007930 TaxID=3364417 RepID=UPI0036EA0BB6